MSLESPPKSQLGLAPDRTIVDSAAAPAAADPPQAPRPGFRKGSAFWLSFVAILVCTFCSALDLTAIATALPTITESLHGGDEFVWIGAAYGLSSTAILPLSGRFSDAFGRRPVMLVAVGLFFVGSAICGAAQSMGMLIAGRSEHIGLSLGERVVIAVLIEFFCTALQGIGGGAILNLSEIIVSDLVPLAERGTYIGAFACVWALASGVGPPIVSGLILGCCAMFILLFIIRAARFQPSQTHGDGSSVRTICSFCFATPSGCKRSSRPQPPAHRYRVPSCALLSPCSHTSRYRQIKTQALGHLVRVGISVPNHVYLTVTTSAETQSS